MKRTLSQVACAALLLASAPAIAQGSGATAISAADRAFLQSAAAGSVYELQLSKWAVQKSQNPQVRQYAQSVVSDHAQSDQQLKKLGQTFNVQLGDTAQPADQASITALTSMTGKAFDEVYLKDMKRVNQQDVKLEQHEAASTSNATLRQFAQHESADDQKHSNEAEQLKP